MVLLSNSIILLILIVITLVVSTKINIIDNTYASSNSSNISISSESQLPVYMITTRGNQNFPQAVLEPGYHHNYELSDINNLLDNCPTEIVIFVHGWHNSEFKAKERLDRVKMSLEHNNYIIPLIGLSWDSDREWNDAKIIAKNNGPKLAKFILNFKNNCPETEIRLLAHSLGARVVLSTLDNLHKDSIWKNNNYKIFSVHLLGASVDDEEVSTNSLDITNDFTNDNTVKSAYGKAIEGEVTKLYNLYNSNDNFLQFAPFPMVNPLFKIYPYFEQDSALGYKGKQEGINISTPPYYDIKIENKIAALGNADGMTDRHFLLCNIFSLDLCPTDIPDFDLGLCIGFSSNYHCQVSKDDNHAGYIGFRNSENINLLKDDGVMDIVVDHWSTQ